MADTKSGIKNPRLVSALQRAREIGLTRDERMHLAEYLLRRDITSWKQLDEQQLCRLLDALEGFQLICELGRQRP